MYLVAGLGVTGQSVLRYFQSRDQKCMAFDSRNNFAIEPLQAVFPDVKFAAGTLPVEWIEQFDTIVLSPGISKNEPWVLELEEAGKQVIGDIELFARATELPIIAITGSNGKSTVTTLVGMILSRAGYNTGVGGNIGVPALDLLIDANEYDVFVLELSSFQLETTYSLATVSSTILNISEDHMDRYIDLEDYISAKARVFDHTELAVVPAELNLNGLLNHTPTLCFSTTEGFVKNDTDYGVIEHKGANWLGSGDSAKVPVSVLKLQGRHHQLNALATMALCQSFNIDSEIFTEVFAEFGGLPHRTELVANVNGVDWINDSKGTNVGATVTAIESLGEQASGKLILIAGGVGKDADFADLAEPIAQYCRLLILFGRDQDSIAKAVSSVSPEVELIKLEDLNSAVNVACENAQGGDIVLFSPACASFDQFQNYVERGEKFVQMVKSLPSS